MKRAVKPIIPPLTEKAYQQRIIDLAKVCGWLHYHPFDSRRSVAGFPDLVLVHPRRKIIQYYEVKTDTGKVSEAQRAWIAALNLAGAQACVVRPAEWDAWLEKWLIGKV